MNTFYNKVLDMRKGGRPVKKVEKVEVKPVISPKKKAKPVKKVDKTDETAVIINDSGTDTDT